MTHFGLTSRELDLFHGLIWQKCNTSAHALLLFGAEERSKCDLKASNSTKPQTSKSTETIIMKFSASIILLASSVAAFTPAAVKKSATSLRVSRRVIVD